MTCARGKSARQTKCNLNEIKISKPVDIESGDVLRSAIAVDQIHCYWSAGRQIRHEDHESRVWIVSRINQISRINHEERISQPQHRIENCRLVNGRSCVLEDNLRRRRNRAACLGPVKRQGTEVSA